MLHVVLRGGSPVPVPSTRTDAGMPHNFSDSKEVVDLRIEQAEGKQYFKKGLISTQKHSFYSRGIQIPQVLCRGMLCLLHISFTTKMDTVVSISPTHYTLNLQHPLYSLLTEQARHVQVSTKMGFKKMRRLYNISNLTENPIILKAIVDFLVERYRGMGTNGPTHILGIPACGYILAAPVAVALGVPFIPLNIGQLPESAYITEGDDEPPHAPLTVRSGSIDEKSRVVIIDDQILTGKTALSALDCASIAGATIVEFATVCDMAQLKGIQLIHKDEAFKDVKILTFFRLHNSGDYQGKQEKRPAYRFALDGVRGGGKVRAENLIIRMIGRINKIDFAIAYCMSNARVEERLPAASYLLLSAGGLQLSFLSRGGISSCTRRQILLVMFVNEKIVIVPILMTETDGGSSTSLFTAGCPSRACLVGVRRLPYARGVHTRRQLVMALRFSTCLVATELLSYAAFRSGPSGEEASRRCLTRSTSFYPNPLACFSVSSALDCGCNAVVAWGVVQPVTARLGLVQTAALFWAAGCLSSFAFIFSVQCRSLESSSGVAAAASTGNGAFAGVSTVCLATSRSGTGSGVGGSLLPKVLSLAYLCHCVLDEYTDWWSATTEMQVPNKGVVGGIFYGLIHHVVFLRTIRERALGGPEEESPTRRPAGDDGALIGLALNSLPFPCICGVHCHTWEGTRNLTQKIRFISQRIKKKKSKRLPVTEMEKTLKDSIHGRKRKEKEILKNLIAPLNVPKVKKPTLTADLPMFQAAPAPPLASALPSPKNAPASAAPKKKK
eukprot:gene9150-6431_t